MEYKYEIVYRPNNILHLIKLHMLEVQVKPKLDLIL